MIQSVTVFDTPCVTVPSCDPKTNSIEVQKQAEIDRSACPISSQTFARVAASSAVQELLDVSVGVSMMSLVRLLGFTTLGCGCVTGRYREVATNREITYVEEKGASCTHQAHRRNHTLTPARVAVHTVTAKAS